MWLSRAGVSRATASLVLRGSDLVAEGTRERVLEAMRELGYVYNRAAANLRAQKSNTIGLVVTDITNPFFAELAVSIETHLDEAGYALLLSNSLDQVEKQDRLLTAMNGRQIDGLILCPAEGTSPQTIELLKTWNLPVVLVARQVPDASFDYAGGDYRTGAKMAVQHLIDQGHEHIAFLGGTAQSSARRERLQGLKDALEGQGLPWNEAYSVLSPVSRQGGYSAILQVLKLDNPPTAALCYNDVVAFGVMLGLQSCNLHPGTDFALIGFDDIEDAALVRPALTTVSIKPRTIGKAAIDLLLERIAVPARSFAHTVQAPELVVRETSR